MTPNTRDAFSSLRHCLPEAANALDLKLGEDVDHWVQTLDHKLLPRMGRNFPLLAAICGGGSTGKSTLFNTLIGRSASPSGGKAGLNRRVLVGLPASMDNPDRVLGYLGQTFGETPDLIERREDLCEPGPPLFCRSENLPAHIALLDTPDIDTGAQGRYTNRDMARQSLEVADIFIYIFTNATYNNLDNTHFISRMLTGMGIRPCYLVYRAYPSFTDHEVREHARTVAKNIYGKHADENVLGLFRADESNEVAAGREAMKIRSVDHPQKGLRATLGGLDPTEARDRVLASMRDDAYQHAARMAAEIRAAVTHLQQYGQSLERAQSKCVRHALSQFPLDRVMRRFAQIWRACDPAHIKAMRTTGKVIEWPLRSAITAIRRFKNPDRVVPPSSSDEPLLRQLEMNLLDAANRLYKYALDDDLSSAGQSLPAPAVARQAQAALANKPWQTTLENIADQKEMVLSWSTQLDEELKALAQELRSRMGIVDQIRQTFAAMLNVIPATAAITYILHTGDPVGAAGIKVKLTGLFGLHDLYALIAIPATAGMSKADRKQLEQMLSPLASTWLAHKLNVVRDLFEAQISGEILSRIRDARTRAQALMEEIDQSLKLLS